MFLFPLPKGLQPPFHPFFFLVFFSEGVGDVGGSVDVVRVGSVAREGTGEDRGGGRMGIGEWVGQALGMKRFGRGARGRAGRIEKPFSNLTIVVREVQAAKV